MSLTVNVVKISYPQNLLSDPGHTVARWGHSTSNFTHRNFSSANLTFLPCESHISPVQISHFSSANLTFLQCKSRISSMQISHFLQCKSHISPVQISHFLPCKSHISPFLAGCSQPSILLVTVWIPKLDRTSGLN